MVAGAAMIGPIDPWSRVRIAAAVFLLAWAAPGAPPESALAQDALGDPAPAGRAAGGPDAAPDAQVPPQAGSTTDGAAEPAAFLPTDRGKERRLDRGRRLIADGRWADAAAVLDELLADERDAFVQADDVASTRGSIRAEAARLVEGMPPEGREAYDSLFRGRADRALADAVRADDVDALAAVARRWFDTPAGRDAALLAAVSALESNQPLVALAWLDRLAGRGDAQRFEPTLSLMRAAAWELVGEPRIADSILAAARGTARVAGRDVRLSAEGREGLEGWLAGSTASGRAAREWRQPRGDPARNGICDASGPLLVPRYRVPLTSHPEEARMLDRRRRDLAATGRLVMPAGTPLAVAGMIVVQTPLGILAVDFETGKRVWLQSATPAAGDAAAPRRPVAAAQTRDRVFDDATSGGLASDGRFVFAVESQPDSLASADHDSRPMRIGPGGWQGGNVLSAYDLQAQGALRWRRPEQGPAVQWHLGAPLVIGSDLFILVEEQGRVRLDVLDANRGAVKWSQPLADFDEEHAVTAPDALARRRAGLACAFGEGVVVCPLGGGTVVAVDVATRTLLWAHTYRRAVDRGPPPDAFGADAGEVQPVATPPGSCPIIAGGRVLLVPNDSDQLLCLSLRDGRPIWADVPRRELEVAGVVAGRVICLGRTGVVALDTDTGRQKWHRGYPPHARPSGRGILTPERLILPLDVPEVMEVAVADGAELAHRAARGQIVPGNLVAYRGEIISRTADSLDVFHQAAALERRIETATRAGTNDDPWASYWRAQSEIEDGDVATGLSRLREAAGRAPPRAVADALVHAMRRDFRTAAQAWRSWVDDSDPAATAPEVLRTAADNCLRIGDVSSAWRACRELLAADSRVRSAVGDPSDPLLAVDPECWLRGRIRDVASRADGPLRGEISATIAGLAASARAEPDPSARLRRLVAVIARLGDQPAPADLGLDLAAEIDRQTTAGDPVPRVLAVRRRLMDAGTPAASAAASGAAPRSEWPFGCVEVRRGRPVSESAVEQGRESLVRVPLAESVPFGPSGSRLMYDRQHRRLSVVDRCGRSIAAQLPLDGGRLHVGMPWADPSASIDASLLGDLLYVRTPGAVTAFDLASTAGASRVLWRHPVGTAPAAAVRLAPSAARVARDRGIALGRRITEPDDLAEGSAATGAPARPGGVLACGPRSVAMLDAASGRVLWERQGVPPGIEWVGDEDFLCGCTADGRGSPVISARDGRIIHAADMPHRRQRLASHGRHVVAIVPLDDAPVAERVRLDIVDPCDRRSRPLGEFPGQSRATLAEPGRLAVVEPGGRLVVIDLDSGTTALAATLPELPQRPEHLSVMAWEDRYLVFVGTSGGGQFDDPAGGLSTLQDMLLAGESTPLLSGAIWAVDRRDGRLLWPGPATVERQALQLSVPESAPVLVFCRWMRAGGGQAQPHVSLVCLDKRTGRGVFEDDRVALRTPLGGLGCEVLADPNEHVLTIGAAGCFARPIMLRFTENPTPPGPPFRAGTRPPEPGRGFESLDEAAAMPRNPPAPGR